MDRYRRGRAGTATVLVLVSVAALFPRLTHAAPGTCDPWIARAVSVQGNVEVRAAGEKRWLPARLNQTYCPGDTVRVPENSRAGVELRNETILRLDQRTTIVFSALEEEEPSWLELLRGAVYFISRVPRALKVRTPYVNAAIEGTEFQVRVEEGQTLVTVFEGLVAVENPAGRLLLASGQSAVTEAGRVPVLRVDIRPEDAVHWTLYYPSVLYEPTFTASPALLRAESLLAVGRVKEAEKAIAEVLAADPRSSHALALQAIIALAQNKTDQALALANEALSNDPASSSAGLALSYARQARFDLKGARRAIEDALAHDPRNALVWARLSELWLSSGYLDKALEAAQKAVALSPDIALTQTVLGFAYLTQIDVKRAKAAFDKAIELNQAAPLPRLGLGLATIRRGKLKKGRRNIEIAASLDPNNSLIRSYLGKAYFEEKRDRLAAEQYALAKALDPNDPTPWFYSAIRKQTINRPVEALYDLQESIELNDNRAVFRSKLLLDQDEAARSASLARIYRDLDFEQLALVEGWKSVNTDPSNFSGHRLLADSYSSLPRHEIARVSELLQAQLLQPLNINPLQPQLTQTNLAILDGAGPSAPSFNEFTPLFTRNRIAFQGNGVVGNKNTWGNDAVVSGISDWLSLSIGQFHYETDGFRANNDLEHDIYNVFAQARLSPKASAQLEWRSRDTDSGDLALRFDPNDFFPSNRFETDTDTFRFGLHYAPTPRSDALLSVIYQDGTDKIFDQSVDPFLVAGFTTQIEADVDADLNTYAAEAQYILHTKRLHAIFGGGRYDQDAHADTDVTVSILELPFIPPAVRSIRSDLDITHSNAYAYSTFRLTPEFALTLGLSYDDLSDASQDAGTDRFNGKLGVVWEVTNATTLRAAAFSVLKRPLLADQTVEPTQVAGFNQFFDDKNGADSRRYGIAVDHSFSRALYVGAELTKRDIDVPRAPQDDDQNEQLHRAYVYWTPSSSAAISAEYQYDSFDRDVPVRDEPRDLRTHIVPLRLSYFATNQLFSALAATYVNQDVEYARATGETTFRSINENGDFWVMDAELGYRFPKRLGTVGVLVKNLLDKNFDFQDRNFQTIEPRTPQFIPERTILLRITLSL